MIGEYCGFCYVERNKDIDYAVKNVGLYKAGTRLEAEWLYYYLTSPIGKQYLNSVKSGSSQPYLTLGGLRKLPILVPETRSVKKKVVKVLSDLDEKIEFNNKINAELEAMAKLIYDYWFVQFDFPDANGKPYKSSGGKMVYNETLKREIPEGWGDGTLDALGEIVGGSTPSTKNPENFAMCGTPWITPNDLSNNVGNKFISRGGQDITDVGVKSASLKIYPKNTVLMSSRAPIGYMAIARNELTTNQGFKSFVPTKGYSSEFVFYTVKNAMKAIIQYSSGSTFKEVSGGVLKTVKICLPATEVANSYAEAVKDVFEKQNILELESEKLAELRDWLLPMLMNGQVTVKGS
ncbi:MAG: restriction endonuclease subunit S [Candidatus Thiodiazotropha sp. (ex Lucina pensylvanica)]|nr:restriction endonuclease subunit S [Candidatus Thiodiazotropha sp. (ex Lucina pensylvanica)]